MEDLKAEFARVVDVLRDGCQVSDIVPESARMLFILESPHIQEIRFGAPVSGLSGASMSRHLFGPEYAKIPLGRLVKGDLPAEGMRQIDLTNAMGAVGHTDAIGAVGHTDAGRLTNVVGQVGLMNVIDIPLQASAYPKGALREEFAPWLQAMEAVRVANNQTHYRSHRASAVQAVLEETLKGKLDRLAGRTLTIVPCGKFAQKFFRLADVTGPAWTIIPDVPHPSYNAWDKERYQPVINAVVREFLALSHSPVATSD